MNETNEPGAAYSLGYVGEGKVSMANHKTTVAQNIDNRIGQLEIEIQRLRDVKKKLAGGSILDVSLQDLQMAMRHY